MADLKSTAGDRKILRAVNDGAITDLLDDLDTLEAENAALRAGHDEAAQRALFMLHIYGGYKVASRGPIGCIHDVLRVVGPEIQKRLADGEEPSEIYADLYGEDE